MTDPLPMIPGALYRNDCGAEMLLIARADDSQILGDIWRARSLETARPGWLVTAEGLQQAGFALFERPEPKVPDDRP